MDADRGLYNKYWVTEDGVTSVEGFVFVLRPDRDPAARIALAAYAKATPNELLRADLERELERIKATQRE